tara:strand:- start:340 stop:768 length:429 start_codon:yes stop_codon:yes gene_type:complete
MTSFDRRPKGRNNNRRHGRRNYGSRSPHVIKLNDQGRSYNNQRNKFNGNASKLYDKYKKLALEALSIGDKVLAENYFQHADHFARILPQFEGPNNISNTNDKVSADSNSISPEDDSSEAQTSDTKRDLQDDSTVIARSSSES